MKKSVSILIGLIYVASIALVSFYGLQYKTFDEVVYVSDIEILNEGIKTDSQGEKYIALFPDENGERKFQIEYRVYPDNATNSEVDFIYDKQNLNVSIDSNGVVTFQKRGSVKVTVVSKDGTSISETIEISFLR